MKRLLLLLLVAVSLSLMAPNPGHPASQVGPGTFSSGNFVFPSQLTVNGNFIVDTNTLFIDGTTNRVGIGTVSPTQALHVTGNTNITGILYTSQICLNGVCETSWPAGTGGDLWTNSSGNATFSSGRVGIGTTTPTDALTVSNGSIRIINPLPLVEVATLPPNSNSGWGTRTVHIERNLLFVGDHGFQWRIYDNANPAQPELIGTRSESAPTRAFATHNNMLYIAQDRVAFFDIANPQTPVLIGSETIVGGNEFDSVHVHGDTLYAGGRYNGTHAVLASFSLADPQNPELLQHVIYHSGASGSNHRIGDIVVRDDIAYTAAFWGVAAFDVSNPADMQLLWNHTQGLGGGYAGKLELLGNTLFVSGFNSGFYALNVSDPNQGTLLDSDGFNGRTIAIAGEYAYVGDEENITIYDISNPSNLQRLGTFNAPIDTLSPPPNMKINGKYLYRPMGDTGLGVFELAGITSPSAQLGTVRAQTIDTNSLQVDMDVRVGGGINTGGAITSASRITAGAAISAPEICLNGVCETSWPTGSGGGGPSQQNASFRIVPDDGLQLVHIQEIDGYNYRPAKLDGTYLTSAPLGELWDFSDPTQPTEMIKLGSLGVISSDAGIAFKQGDYLYVGNEIGNPSFITVDISNLSNPVVVDVLNYTVQDSRTSEITAGGGYLYVGTTVTSGDYNFMVIDITTPDKPRIRGTLNFTAEVDRIDYWNGYAFIVDGSDFTAIDVRDPDNPFIASTLSVSTDASNRMEIAWPTAFVSNSNTIRIINITNPESMNEITTIAPHVIGGYQSRGMAYADGYLYAGYYWDADEFDVYVIDVNNLSNPEVVGRYNLSSPANLETRVLGAIGEHLLVRTGVSGSIQIFVYELPHLRAPAVRTGWLRTTDAIINRDLYVGRDITGQGSLTLEAIRARATISASSVRTPELNLNTDQEMPTCDANRRGAFRVEARGTSEDDLVWGCLKNATESYNWVLIARGG